MEKETRYFKVQVHSRKTILFIKPPENKAIAIYIYHGNQDRSFGQMGHAWTLKEITEKGGVEITKHKADNLLIS